MMCSAKPGEAVCEGDVVIHLFHLAGQFPVIVPEFEHLDVCVFDQVDEIRRVLGVAENGGCPLIG